MADITEAMKAAIAARRAAAEGFLGAFHRHLPSEGIALGTYSTDNDAARQRPQFEAFAAKLASLGADSDLFNGYPLDMWRSRVRSIIRRMPENRVTDTNSAVFQASGPTDDPTAGEGVDATAFARPKLPPATIDNFAELLRNFKV